MNCCEKDRLLKILDENQMDAGHPLHVTGLAGRLFDELRDIHGMGEKEKKCLLYAAMLHDIGIAKSVKGHHKHSMEIILDSEIPGIDDRKKLIVANIARYHRKSLPSPKHKMYALLDEKDKTLVQVLSSLLRIADGLDRTHLSFVKDISVETDKEKITINYISERRYLPEEEAALKKSDLFEEIFNRKVLINWEKN